MFFLASEEDLSLKKTILYFYSSSAPNIINNNLFAELKNKDVCCIDIKYFNKIFARFNIKTVPTMLFIEEGTEKKRITGVKNVLNISKLLVYKNEEIR